MSAFYLIEIDQITRLLLNLRTNFWVTILCMCHVHIGRIFAPIGMKPSYRHQQYNIIRSWIHLCKAEVCITMRKCILASCRSDWSDKSTVYICKGHNNVTRILREFQNFALIFFVPSRPKLLTRH